MNDRISTAAANESTWPPEATAAAAPSLSGRDFTSISAFRGENPTPSIIGGRLSKFARRPETGK